ncbi:hypothetical protein BD289DRAFT_19516 [Coniella lustricola]|uniref:Uncharacterized protein n=1 Tax=Coniella lustricola TaxID=2025994 RepID=A0A2T3AJD6_9PEZI|nr:hypothetical protein BD289DRAFT_19516 [Coniella lustricola]
MSNVSERKHRALFALLLRHQTILGLLVPSSNHPPMNNMPCPGPLFGNKTFPGLGMKPWAMDHRLLSIGEDQPGGREDTRAEPHVNPLRFSVDCEARMGFLESTISLPGAGLSTYGRGNDMNWEMWLHHHNLIGPISADLNKPTCRRGRRREDSWAIWGDCLPRSLVSYLV